MDFNNWWEDQGGNDGDTYRRTRWGIVKLWAKTAWEDRQEVIEQKDKRIKELESTILDLQSELARKKYSLSVACNRVEELEGKLKVAISALKKVDNIAYEYNDKVLSDIAYCALEQLGELK